jgi:hypothetical protein
MEQHEEGIGFLGALFIGLAFDLVLIALFVALRAK